MQLEKPAGALGAAAGPLVQPVHVLRRQHELTAPIDDHSGQLRQRQVAGVWNGIVHYRAAVGVPGLYE